MTCLSAFIASMAIQAWVGAGVKMATASSGADFSISRKLLNWRGQR